MPRKPRYFLPGVAVQVVQRGHNEGPVFFNVSDYEMYLTYLRKAAERYDCAVHSYVLLKNQVRMLVTPPEADSVSRMMQYIGRYYVDYVNRNYNSTGTLWDGRYRSCLVQDSAYLLACMRYIELTPVRLGLLEDINQQRWSSYYANAYGRFDPVLTPHALYWKLGDDEADRCRAYLAFCGETHDHEAAHTICTAWRTGTPLGNDHFKRMIEQKLNCKLGSGKPGRPRKEIIHVPTPALNYGGFFNHVFKAAKR